MPPLALAQKLLGKAAQAGVPAPRRGIADEPGGDAPRLAREPLSQRQEPTSETELGDALLALAATARDNGWDAERALRERLRALRSEIRNAESGLRD
jgi:XTP/dITP diphosphohydrolase